MNYALTLVLFLSGCTIVPPGHVAVQEFYGDLSEEVLYESGFYTSIFTTVIPISTQVMATQSASTAVTKDLQKVKTEVTLNWSRNPTFVREQHERYPDMEVRIITPAIQEVVKSITAQSTAAELIQKRQKVKEDIISLLSARLTPVGITIDTVNITDFDYSEEFNDSIEKKVQAEQDSQRALEELEKTKIVAQQQVKEARGKRESAILVAEGEAEAIRIQGAVLKENPMVLELFTTVTGSHLTIFISCTKLAIQPIRSIALILCRACK